MNKSGQIRFAIVALLGAVSAVSAVAQTTTNVAWVSSVAAGLTLTRGNSDTTMGTLSGTTAKKWDSNELAFGADFVYGETKIGNNPSTENADSDKGVAQYNKLVGDRFYAYGRFEALHDGIADIQYRLTLAPGAGYYFIKNKTADLSLEVGPGFIAEKLGDQYSSFMTLRIAEKFHYVISDRARLWETIELLPQVDNFTDYILNSELGIEADITQDKRFTLRSFIDFSRDNVPAPGRLKNDTKLVTAIAYKF